MLEKSAKISNVIQGFATASCLYSYISQRQAADPAMVRSLSHPSWLPLVSIVFLAASVLTSSVLTLVVLSNKGIDIQGKILRGYLDLRAFRAEAAGIKPRWVNLPNGCCVKLYAELVNRNDVGARFYAETTRLELRVGRERFYGTWERIIPSQQAITEGGKETLNDLFDALYPNDSLGQGIPWNGYVGFIVEKFNRALLHDRTVLKANVKVQIHDTLGRVHTIKGDRIRLALEEVCLPSEFAA
jgi:hypothetical protein